MSGAVHEQEHRPAYLKRPGGLVFWTALLLAPATFLGHLVLNYFMVAPMCRRGVEWPLHVVTLLALLACGAAALSGRKLREETGEHLVAEGVSRLERTRFVANVGLLATALFTLMILAQWVGVLVFHPCDRV